MNEPGHQQRKTVSVMVVPVPACRECPNWGTGKGNVGGPVAPLSEEDEMGNLG